MTKFEETSKLKTETFLLLKTSFIWSKIYRVVNNSVNVGVVEIYVGNFLEKGQLFRNFGATCGQGHSLVPPMVRGKSLPKDQHYYMFFIRTKHVRT